MVGVHPIRLLRNTILSLLDPIHPIHWRPKWVSAITNWIPMESIPSGGPSYDFDPSPFGSPFDESKPVEAPVKTRPHWVLVSEMDSKLRATGIQ